MKFFWKIKYIATTGTRARIKPAAINIWSLLVPNMGENTFSFSCKVKFSLLRSTIIGHR